jgi:hypothetical protein
MPREVVGYGATKYITGRRRLRAATNCRVRLCQIKAWLRCAQCGPCPRSLRSLRAACASLSPSEVTVKYCTDMSAAGWIVEAQIPRQQLVYFGPPGFPAYARLRFIRDPTKPGQDEGDANVAEDHPSDIEQTRRALDHLRRFTATPEDCYFCVWEGYGDPNLRRCCMSRW